MRLMTSSGFDGLIGTKEVTKWKEIKVLRPLLKIKKRDQNLVELINKYKNKTVPIMPVKADILMSKFNISEGKVLGDKLKIIEDEWVKNNFQISDKQVENIIKD